MKRRQKYLIAISTGLLLWLAWPPLPFFFLLFIAFVPLLWLEDEISSSKKSASKFFGYSYLSLLIWNVCTTWWVGNTWRGTGDISTAIAGLFANTANPLLMCIALIGFHNTRKRLGNTIGYLSLPFYWITFEFIHLRWELTWPWLTLGNGFAQFPQVVQWYEYTGVFGGTLWIWMVNILIYRAIKIFIAGRIYERPFRKLAIAALVIFIPVLISLVQYFSYSEKGVTQEVVIVQPNIDPYKNKFDENYYEEQLQTLIRLSNEKVDSLTDYLVWPETAIQDNIDVGDLQSDPVLKKIRTAFSTLPSLTIITGVNGYAVYPTAQTATARYYEEGNYYWDAFNTALQLDSSVRVEVYQKSKLVPGVERMPYPKLFGFLEALSLDVGGISGSLGTQPDREVFFSDDSIGIAPEVCYESIFGEYTNEYVQNGANLIFIITNDGWWGNTAGYKQHLQYGRLRAVETRRCVAQSANTGTSAFINQRGDISQATLYWVPDVIKSTLLANDRITLYVRFGDYIGRLAIILTIAIAAYSFYRRFRPKKVN